MWKIAFRGISCGVHHRKPQLQCHARGLSLPRRGRLLLWRHSKKMSSSNNTDLFDVISKVGSFLTCVTFKLWDSINYKDETAQINATLKAKFKLKLTAVATEEILQMLSNIDLTNPSKKLDDYTDKRHKPQVATLRRELKTEIRKKTMWTTA